MHPTKINEYVCPEHHGAPERGGDSGLLAG
jgi:hypothetical protein